MGSSAFEVLILPACRGVMLGLEMGCLMLMLTAAAGFLIDQAAAILRAAARGSDVHPGDRLATNIRPSRASRRAGSPHVEFRFNRGQEMFHGYHILP